MDKLGFFSGKQLMERYREYIEKGKGYSDELSYRLGYFEGFFAEKDKSLTEDEIINFRQDHEYDKLVPSSYKRGLHHGFLRSEQGKINEEEVFAFLKMEEKEGFQP